MQGPGAGAASAADSAAPRCSSSCRSCRRSQAAESSTASSAVQRQPAAKPAQGAGRGRVGSRAEHRRRRKCKWPGCAAVAAQRAANAGGCSSSRTERQERQAATAHLSAAPRVRRAARRLHARHTAPSQFASRQTERCPVRLAGAKGPAHRCRCLASGWSRSGHPAPPARRPYHRHMCCGAGTSPPLPPSARLDGPSRRDCAPARPHKPTAQTPPAPAAWRRMTARCCRRRLKNTKGGQLRAAAAPGEGQERRPAGGDTSGPRQPTCSARSLYRCRRG